eukprot:5341283-Pleurochrysis_carterae.AAC.1
MPTLSAPDRTHLCHCASGERCFRLCACGISLACESSNTTCPLCGRACVPQQAYTQRTNVILTTSIHAARAFRESYKNQVHATPNGNTTALAFSSICNASSRLTAVSSDYKSLAAQRRQ